MSERSNDDLLRIVGAERLQHSADVVAAAEAELRGRLTSDTTDATSRVRTAARVSLLIGLVNMCTPLLALQAPVDPNRSIPLGFAVQTWVQGILGLILAMGGVGLWRHRAWGRNLVVFVLWAVTAYVVGFTVYLAFVAAAGAPLEFRIILGVVGVLMGLFWALLLRRGITYLSQPQIVALLGR